MIIQPTFNNRVRYTLKNDKLGTRIISEPEGWDDDEKEFKRSTKVHGVFINLSNNLKFHRRDGGFNYIKQVFDEQGINADILLIKEEKHPQTDIFKEAYRGFLDLSTMIIEKNKISVKFNESGLYQSLKARQSEKLELERLDTMDGDVLEPLTKNKVALDGRDILIVSELKRTKGTGFETPSGVNTVINNENDSRLKINHITGLFNEVVCLPITATSNEGQNVQTVFDYNLGDNGSSYNDGSTNNMFYANSVNDITLKVNFDISLNIPNDSPSEGDLLRLDLVKFKNGVNYEFKEFETLGSTISNRGSVINYTANNKEIPLLVGESLALALHSNASVGVFLHVDITKSNITIYDETFFEKSQSEFVLPFEALQRLVNITTNEKDAVVSNFLGRTDLNYSVDGEGSLVGITNGFNIRGFTDRNIQTSFKDFEESYSAVHNTGYGIEKRGFKEFVRFEKLEHFYQNIITIKLPNQVSDVKRTVAKDYFYSGLELGYKKGGSDYDEAMGLDEYNTKNTYTTIIKRIEKVFSKLSTYRADSYGMEFARRKPVLSFPTEDTRYDKEIFFLDLKRGLVDVFEQRKWQDDFEKEPTGVFSPETATNLRLSPVNILRRFGWWVRAGLDKYRTSSISFSSSEGNSDLSTKLINENEYSERGNIKVNDLEKNRIIPEFIEFTHPVTTDILNQVQGKIIVNNDTIMNYYGLVEFENESGLLEYGYLMELKPNKEGKWKLLKSSKQIAKKTLPASNKQVSISPVLTVDNGITFVTLNWTGAVLDEDIKYYRVFVNGVLKYNTNNLTQLVDNLIQDTGYSFYIQGVTDSDKTINSNIVSIKTLNENSNVLPYDLNFDL